MDKWKSRGGKSQRGEEQKREDKRRKKMQVREKVAVSSALNFPFLKEVSQNCFVFDVVNLKN